MRWLPSRDVQNTMADRPRTSCAMMSSRESRTQRIWLRFARRLPRMTEHAIPLSRPCRSWVCIDALRLVAAHGRIQAIHYSERQSLGASPSFGVFDNALPADSLTLYMAPGRGCWPTAPGQPSAPASREGPGGVAARGWWSVRERLIGMCRTACRDGRVMWMSPLRHGGQPA